MKVILRDIYQKKKFKQEIISICELVQEKNLYKNSSEKSLHEIFQSDELHKSSKEINWVSYRLLSALFDMLLNDDFMMKIREELQFNSNKFINWENRDELLWKNDHFYISANKSLQIKLIERYHDILLTSHFIIARTYELMSYKFF